MGDEAKKRLEFEKEFNKIDPHASWIYQPHTVTFFLVVVGIATYFAFNQENVSFESNVKYGLSAVGIIFLLFSSVQMKDGLFYRPHPVVWRTVMGAGVLYLCTLVFFLFQNVEDARGLLNKFDSRLGIPLPERSYADHCDLYTPHDPSGNKFKNLWDTVNDEFIIAHLFGWLGKALFLRDVYLCWFMSILFEILEVTFEHMLPNFKECWWDHIILDILVCNWLGFTIGLKVVEYFQMKRYNFIAPNVEAYHWQVLTDWKRLVYVVGLMIVISVVELNAFFLKFVLYVPPPHPINVIRLILWWSIGLPAVREYYYYVIDKRCKKFGPMAWLAVAIMTLELLICIKFGKGMFPTPHPDIVVYSWLAFVAAFVLWAVIYYGFFVGKSAENSFPTEKGSARPAFIEKNDVAISNKSNGKVKNRKQKGNQ